MAKFALPYGRSILQDDEAQLRDNSFLCEPPYGQVPSKVGTYSIKLVKVLAVFQSVTRGAAVLAVDFYHVTVRRILRKANQGKSLPPRLP